ncbi:MAG: ABC transporter substrate-binding protein [Thermoanaerobaculia bacterium]
MTNFIKDLATLWSWTGELAAPGWRRVAVPLGLAFCGCVSPETPEVGSPHGSGTHDSIVIATSADITGVNQLLSGDTRFNQNIIDQMFLHLFEEQPDFAAGPPTFAPQLATHYEWSSDHTELTLHLRDDVTWSDGEPVTAHDVYWTWKAQTDPDIAWAYAQSKENIRAIETIDDTTLRIKYGSSSTSQLANLNEGVILPKHIWSTLAFREWRQNSRWFTDNLVVSGPYILDSWKQNQEIVLKPNAKYSLEDPESVESIETIVFRNIPETTNQLHQLRAGAVDFVERVPPAAASRLSSSDEIRLIKFSPRQYSFICWNTMHPLFADAAIRKALTLGIDRAGIIENLWYGQAKVSTSPIISSVWAFNSDLQVLDYDPRAATAILRERGWVDSDGDGVLDREGESFKFSLTTNAGNRLRSDAAVMIQSQLLKIGVVVVVRKIEFNTLLEMNQSHRFDATIGAWGIDTSLDLKYAFHSASIDQGYNYGGYRNVKVDRLIDHANQQTDLNALKLDLWRIQQILHDEQPYTFLWEPQRVTAVRNRVQGVQPNSLSAYFQLHRWRLVEP